jgi:hypothetical protein
MVVNYLDISPEYFFELIPGFDRGGRIRMYRLMDMARKLDNHYKEENERE